MKRRFFRTTKYVIGIDEVGRGPLAGPLVFGACAFPSGYRFKNPPAPLRDSKKLSQKQREAWSAFLKTNEKVVFCLKEFSVKAIDQKGLGRVVRSGPEEVFQKILKRLPENSSVRGVYLDGGLFLLNDAVHQETIIKGDEKVPVISCASILAKVYRDRLMRGLAPKFPHYAWELNKGYGTKAHTQAIRKFGSTKHHRLTFISKFHRIRKN